MLWALEMGTVNVSDSDISPGGSQIPPLEAEVENPGADTD